MRFACLMLCLCLPTLTLAENLPPSSFPIQGYVNGNLLHVPTYREQHEAIPMRLFAYGGGREFVAQLRKNTPYIALSDEHHDCDNGGAVGEFIYEIAPSKETVKVIIFDVQKYITFVEDKLIEVNSHTEWQLFHLGSHEGVHDILRTQKNGICISHIDRYTHCNYDTEADSDQAFQAAMCGQKIECTQMGF